MPLQMHVSNELIYFVHFWRQWLYLGIAGISKETLLDEMEKKMKKVVENAKPANFNSTANENNTDSNQSIVSIAKR